MPYPNPIVAGVPLDRFREPISTALEAYSRSTNYGITFAPDSAVNLRKTPGMPYAAISQTPLRHLGEVAGVLSVVALGPNDDTGRLHAKPADQAAGDSDTVQATSSIVVPRSRAGVVSEVYMPLACLPLVPRARPLLFVGSLALLGPGSNNHNRRVQHLVDVGQEELGHGNDAPDNTVVYTPMAYPIVGSPKAHQQRNGYPNASLVTSYALQNPHQAVQVFALATLTLAAEAKHLDALDLFATASPVPVEHRTAL